MIQVFRTCCTFIKEKPDILVYLTTERENAISRCLFIKKGVDIYNKCLPMLQLTHICGI